MTGVDDNVADEWHLPTLDEPERLNVVTELQRALEEASLEDHAFVLTCLEDVARHFAERSWE